MPSDADCLRMAAVACCLQFPDQGELIDRLKEMAKEAERASQ